MALLHLAARHPLSPAAHGRTRRDPEPRLGVPSALLAPGVAGTGREHFLGTGSDLRGHVPYPGTSPEGKPSLIRRHVICVGTEEKL